MDKIKFFIVLTLFLVINNSSIATAIESHHSHFRFTHITWEEAGINTADFTVTAGFRRNGFQCISAPSTTVVPCSESDGYPGIGDFFREYIGGTNLNFGDGTPSTSTLTFKVFAFNKDDNWILAKALEPGTTNEAITHSYPNSGPYTASIDSCCRTGVNSTNAHINNPNGRYRIESAVNFSNYVQGFVNLGNPKSMLPPIIDCPQNNICSFSVPAIDKDNHTLRWRLSTSSEAGGGFTQPLGASIDSNNGTYTWHTVGVTLGSDGFDTLYSTQVTIEDLDQSGNVISKSAIDFFIRLVPTLGANTTIQVPIRWCVVEGSSVADLSDNERNDYLQNRIDLVNSRVFTPQASIQFIFENIGSIPIIEDPCHPNEPCTDRDDPIIYNGGILGDIVIDDIGTEELFDEDWEYQKARNLCRKAWQNSNHTATGIIAIQAKMLRNTDGTDSFDGLATIPEFGNIIELVLSSGMIIKEESELGQSSFNERTKFVAHELGHTLSLFHGDGVNQDGDNELDEPDEIELNDNGDVRQHKDAPHNLMGYDDGGGHHLFPSYIAHFRDEFKINSIEVTELQKNRIRDQSTLLVNSKTADLLADSKVSELSFLPLEGYLDIANLGISIDQQKQLTTFALSPLGKLPDNISDLNYTFFADLDNNTTTGGSLIDVGFTSQLQGVEIIGQIVISIVDGIIQTTPYIKVFNSSTQSFTDMVDPRIKGIIIPTSIASFHDQLISSHKPTGQIITLEVPNDIVGQIAINFQLSATAEDPDTGTIDTADVEITFEKPVYPTCQVIPTSAIRGNTVTVTASDLTPFSIANVFVGGQQSGTGLIDSVGNVVIDFQIPENIPTGTQPVRVGVEGTAISANCAISLQAIPYFNTPPSPESGTALSISVGTNLTFDIQVIDDDIDDDINLNVIGLPTGAFFSIPATSNPANSNFSWIPTSGQEGDYVLIFTAHDNNGLSASPHSITIRVVSKGDLDHDNDIDRNDLKIITSYRNQPASACPECDIDGDGTITVNDVRKAMLLCTRSRCAVE